MLPNAEAKGFYGNQVEFQDVLLSECEKDGVAVANITRIHESLLAKKRYVDMTGNNVNHPNDYITRIYVQALMKTLTIREEQENEPVSSTENSYSQSVSNGCFGTASGAICGALIVCAVSLLRKQDE